jgi:hypothetical protein
MGNISKRLHRRLASAATHSPKKAPKRRPNKPMSGGISDIQALIDKGLDPVHAAYVYVQQSTSYFAEQVSVLPEMRTYAKIVGAAEDEYMPGFPPMSPVTTSFFTTWAFYDLRIGGTGDTIGGCLIDASDLFPMNPDQLEALKNLSDSRIGIYEHLGIDGQRVRLKELLTEREFSCHSGSGYRGRAGELWYVRRLPPLLPEVADYHVVFTTPYILLSPKDDWVQFLQRSLSKHPGDDRQNGLCRLLKDGPSPNYWNEFVFLAYHHHQNDAIYLAGIPDLRATLPHAN